MKKRKKGSIARMIDTMFLSLGYVQGRKRRK